MIKFLILIVVLVASYSSVAESSLLADSRGALLRYADLFTSLSLSLTSEQKAEMCLWAKSFAERHPKNFSDVPEFISRFSYTISAKERDEWWIWLNSLIEKNPFLLADPDFITDVVIFCNRFGIRVSVESKIELWNKLLSFLDMHPEYSYRIDLVQSAASLSLDFSDQERLDLAIRAREWLEKATLPSLAVINPPISMNITNTVVHIFSSGVFSPSAINVTNVTGFVTVITEVIAGSSRLMIPESWSTNFPSFKTLYGSDFPSAVVKPTSKKDSDGNAMYVWQDYIAGTDPTNPHDRFVATLTIVNGRPEIDWTPKLPEAISATRLYTIWGKEKISDSTWQPIGNDASQFNFFKVTVEMR
jgi:hypothetical protein